MLVRPLADLLSLQLRAEVAGRDEELLDRPVEPYLLVREVIEEAHASIEEILDHDPGAEGVASDPGLVADDNDIEQLLLCGIEEGNEAGPLLELGPAVVVIDEDVLG